MKEAVALVREKRPELLVEGPLQYDAAVDPAIAAVKIKVGGSARPHVQLPALCLPAACQPAAGRHSLSCQDVGVLI